MLTLSHAISLNNLSQLNRVSNEDGKTLDLVISNISGAYVAEPLHLLSKLDPKHPTLLLNISCSGTNFLRPKHREDYNYFKADYTGIISELENIDWNQKFSSTDDVNCMVSEFYTNLRSAIDKYVPKRIPKKSKYPPWFSFLLIKLLSEKEKYRIRYKKYQNPRDKYEFEILRDRSHLLLIKNSRDYHNAIEVDITKNPKQFWRYMKSKRNGCASIPSSVHLNNIVANTGTEIAESFASHFSSVYTVSSSAKFSNAASFKSGKCISVFSFEETDVLKIIKKLDIYKGAGPDCIPPLFVKHCGSVLSLPLTLIFNFSLKKGQFPDEWKRARIVPVHKKGDIADIKNYRPISILSCFSKMFESLVCPLISYQVDKDITIYQHGFKCGRSTQTNLVSFISDVSQEIDKGKRVDAIYTDFSSAFDKVNHSLLVHKLEVFGVHGLLLRWFTSYLERRSQIVAVGGFESKSYYAESGVPQGSHLGPVLFSIFINDLSSKIQHCKYSMFADDLKFYRSVNCPADVDYIQNDLENVAHWCSDNEMVLNAMKCFHITFSRQKQPSTSTYKLDGVQLKVVKEVSDLGVIIDTKLKFIPHVDTIVKKAAKMLGFLKRNTKSFRRPQTKLLLYNALVRSILEYACTAWSPMYSIHSQRIESIQRAFTRYLAFTSQGITHRCTYTQRLEFFKMSSLHDRRILLDTIFLHKLVGGKIDCSQLLAQISLTVPRALPRHPITRTFCSPLCRTNLGTHAPLVRMFNQYNLLNQKLDIDIFHESTNNFKRKISNYYICTASAVAIP